MEASKKGVLWKSVIAVYLGPFKVYSAVDVL